MGRTKGLKPKEDAFGQMLWAYYQGKEVFDVWERNDNYISVSSPKTYFLEYEDWPLHQRTAIEFVKGKVLDIDCGACRHSLYLQKKGFEILGIDRSPLAVNVCKLRGMKRAEVMSIEDIIVKKSSSFDTIIMLGNNFSLFGSYKKGRRLLKKLHRITSRAALIIAETRDPYKTDNSAYSDYYELNRKRKRMSGQLRGRDRFEKFVSPWFDWLMVSKDEMKEILNGTGWKVKEFIDSGDVQYIAIIEKIA